MTTSQDFPTAVIAQRLKAIRRRYDVTAEELAERMRAVGVPFEKTVIANLETGRRRYVTVQELLALAYVLNVAPMYLLTQTEEAAMKVVPTPQRADDPHHGLVSATDVRKWFAGEEALPETDVRIYYSEVDDATFRARHRRMTGGDDGR